MSGSKCVCVCVCVCPVFNSHFFPPLCMSQGTRATCIQDTSKNIHGEPSLRTTYATRLRHNWPQQIKKVNQWQESCQLNQQDALNCIKKKLHQEDALSQRELNTDLPSLMVHCGCVLHLRGRGRCDEAAAQPASRSHSGSRRSKTKERD